MNKMKYLSVFDWGVPLEINNLVQMIFTANTPQNTTTTFH